ncbi:MAG TPA: TonB-dependent receptor [Bacteroidia bacterium]|nr:TonB-dependent receptor [Bacteroidia bacterium]
MGSQEITEQQKAGAEPLLSKRQKRQIEWLLIGLMTLGYVAATMAQPDLHDLNYQAISEFQPTIKDAIKFSDVPEIKDSVKRIQNIRYGITSNPVLPKYQVQAIDAAKLQNEPLPKLYHSLLKLGYGPIYNMPYGEFWISNTRSRSGSVGAHLKHFSSTAHLRDVGYSGFSDNQINVFGKHFYKKHTLSGDFNYERNVLDYYGYDTSINTLDDKKFTRQRYQFINPKIHLVSHYADSSHFNHNIRLGYYNLQNLYRETENNIRLNGQGSMFINKEKLNIHFLTDYYNHKQSNDTLNDLIVSLNPSFEANGKKWHADLGLTATLDYFKGSARFYFYPQLNVNYNAFNNMLVPYAGINGGLIKNSFRKLTQENPFADTTLNYTNTNNKFTGFAGLKGHLSANTAYDAKVSYARYDSLHFFVMNYGGTNRVYNRFDVMYDNTSLLTVTGQLTHQVGEKLNLIAKGNYYYYKTKNLVHAYHKPDFDITFSGIYNLQSKFIVRADFFFLGKQWALTQSQVDGEDVLTPKQLKGYADLNLEVEYRYSKMLSFFARANNIANQRYYRWERYPSQRFNFMLGLSFVPF